MTKAQRLWYFVAWLERCGFRYDKETMISFYLKGCLSWYVMREFKDWMKGLDEFQKTKKGV